MAGFDLKILFVSLLKEFTI